MKEGLLMDRVQVERSEQITINKELVVAYDQPIKTKDFTKITRSSSIDGSTSMTISRPSRPRKEKWSGRLERKSHRFGMA